MADGTLDDSLRLATTNTRITKGTIVSQASTTGIPLIEICNKFLLWNNFNEALSYFSLLFSIVLFYISYVQPAGRMQSSHRFCVAQCRFVVEYK